MREVTPLIYIGAVLLAVVATSVLFANVSHANPEFFLQSPGTATATTSPQFMTTGTATTTEQFDAQTGTVQSMKQAALLVQFTASSTVSVLSCQIERSMDAVDWYQDNYISAATSTLSTIPVAGAKQISWTFASTSQQGGVISATNNRGLKVFYVDTPTRYTRAFCGVTGANGAVWMKFIGKREQN